MRYEGYGPGGVAIIIEALTDNKNRTVSDVRHALTKNGGNLGSSGCVSYLFEKRGLLQFETDGIDSDALMEAAMDAGAEDIVESEGQLEIVTTGTGLSEVRVALEAGGFVPREASLSMEPSTTVALEGKEAEQMLRLSDVLEDLDDVQNFYANFDISEEEMSRFV